MAPVHLGASVALLLRMWIFRKYLICHTPYPWLDHLTHSVLFLTHLLSQILSWLPCTLISCPFQQASMYLLYLCFNGLSNFWIFCQPEIIFFQIKLSTWQHCAFLFVCLFHFPPRVRSAVTRVGCRAGSRSSACPREVPAHMQNQEDKR